MNGENTEKKIFSKEKFKKKWSLGGVTLAGALLFAFLIAFDLITKELAEKFLSDGTTINLFGCYVRLRLVYNRGISFGMFSDGSAASKIAIIAVTSLMMLLLAVFYLFVDKRRRVLRVSLVFIVAGGIGNLIDRLLFRMWQADGVKGVRDMVDVSGIRFGSFNFGICNFADFFITAGAIMLVLSFLFFDADALFPTKKYRKLAKTLEEEKGVASDSAPKEEEKTESVVEKSEETSVAEQEAKDVKVDFEAVRSEENPKDGGGMQ